MSRRRAPPVPSFAERLERGIWRELDDQRLVDLPALIDHLDTPFGGITGRREISGAYKRALKNELTGKNDIPAPFQPLA